MNEIDTCSTLHISNDINMLLLSNSNRNTIAMDNNDNNLLLRYFSPNYIGPIIKLFECTDKNKNVSNWYPVKVTKFFTNQHQH